LTADRRETFWRGIPQFNAVDVAHICIIGGRFRAMPCSKWKLFVAIVSANFPNDNFVELMFEIAWRR